jgi:hypothetical protein
MFHNWCPSITPCFPALSNTAVSGHRGPVGMVLSNATQECYGDERYTRCLYVLGLSARQAIVADAGHVSGGIHILGLQGHTGQLEFLSTLYSGSEAQAILPLSSSARRFVRGLGGARAMQISSDGLVMVLGSWEEQGVLLFDRDKTTVRLTYGDMMTEGERMTWLFNSVLPPPSPAALPFTLPPVSLEYTPDALGLWRSKRPRGASVDAFSGLTCHGTRRRWYLLEPVLCRR